MGTGYRVLRGGTLTMSVDDFVCLNSIFFYSPLRCEKSTADLIWNNDWQPGLSGHCRRPDLLRLLRQRGAGRPGVWQLWRGHPVQKGSHQWNSGFENLQKQGMHLGGKGRGAIQIWSTYPRGWNDSFSYCLEFVKLDINLDEFLQRNHLESLELTGEPPHCIVQQVCFFQFKSKCKANCIVGSETMDEECYSFVKTPVAINVPTD